MKKVEIYTDGACQPSLGVGGWAAILCYDGMEKELFGGGRGTNSDRMELQAAIKGLEALEEPCEVLLVTDSKYLKDGLAELIVGQKTIADMPLIHKSLWVMLSDLLLIHKVTVQWVPAHSGHPYNERSDALAVKARLKWEG